MMIRLGLVIGIVAVGVTTVVAQVRDVESAEALRQLASGAASDRSRAIAAIRQSPALQADDRIRLAVILELSRVNRERHLRYARWARGEDTAGLAFDGEYDLAVVSTVVALRDQRAIPALIDAVDTGDLVARALADFGRRALPQLVKRWRARTDTERQHLGLFTSGLLWTLNRMATLDDLDADARQEAVSVAGEALARPDNSIGLENAISLAVTLRDPGLLQEVETFSRDFGEVARRGIKDVDEVDRIQRHARQALEKVK